MRFDQPLADSMKVVGDADGLSPQAGDYCFIGATESDKHDYQGRFGSMFGNRLMSGKGVVLYCPAEKSVELVAEEEDQYDRTRKLNSSVAAYACGIPFDSYDEYRENVDDRDVLLSEEQFDILNEIVNDNANRSTILMGCAGSGKTLMAVTILLCQKMIGGEEDRRRRLYFSLSDRLSSASETSYSKILACKAASEVEAKWIRDFAAIKADVLPLRRVPLKDLTERAVARGIADETIEVLFGAVDVGFHDANAFLCRYLGMDRRNLVLYNRFKDEFYDRLSESDREIDADDLWTEIRGLIKGYQGAHAKTRDYTWYWGICEYHLLRDMFGTDKPNWADLAEVQKELERVRAVDKPSGETGFVWKRIDGNAEAAVKKSCQTESRKELVSRMFALVREDDYRKREMTLGEYLGLSDEQSVFDRGVRRRIYKLYLRYRQWLEDEGLFDENDLAREALVISSGPDFRPLPADIVVIDECQDFSEMQLRALVRLVGEESRLLFAGDRHQIINPTYFDPERLQQMPEAGNTKVYSVCDNHRSSREIVEIANVVAAKRKSCIGSWGPKYEQPETSSVGGHYPHFLNYGTRPESLTDGLERVAEDPTAAFIVHDDADRRELLGLMSPEARQSAEINTFTIKECKGLEFKKVFCYKILGRHGRAWESILSPGVAERKQKYRYYFNTLYVSITRSQSGICLLESQTSERLHHDWLVVPGKFQQETAEEFDRILSEFEWKTGNARVWLAAAHERLEQALGSKDVGLFSRALRGFKLAAAKQEADDDLTADAANGEHVCEIEIAKLKGRSLDAALACVRYRLLDRLPELEDVSDAERGDVQLVLNVLEDGFGGMSGQTLRRAIALLSDSEAGREYIQRAMEMKANDIALSARLATEELKSA